MLFLFILFFVVGWWIILQIITEFHIDFHLKKKDKILKYVLVLIIFDIHYRETPKNAISINSKLQK